MILTTTEKTGHQYYGTKLGMEIGCDECGTCDGAKCELCRTKYTVERISNSGSLLLYEGFDKDLARKIADQETAPIFEFYRIENEDKDTDYIVECGFSPDCIPTAIDMLLELFTHEQFAEFRTKIREICSHLESILSDRDLCRSEVHTYTLNSRRGECFLTVKINSINGIFRGVIDINIGFFEEYQTDDDSEDSIDGDANIFIDISHSILNTPGMLIYQQQTDKMIDGFRHLVAVLDAAYNVTELRAPEEAFTHFLDLVNSMRSSFWDVQWILTESSESLPHVIVKKGKEIIVG